MKIVYTKTIEVSYAVILDAPDLEAARGVARSLLPYNMHYVARTVSHDYEELVPEHYTPAELDSMPVFNENGELVKGGLS